MKIGVIGLGNIAQKAYLPVMATMRDEVEWHLCSRKETTVEELGRKYGFQHLYTNQEEWMNSGIEAAFVHAATSAHGSLIKALLEKKIHVYVDKPISEDLDETRQLLELAEENGVLLTAGFNRRFAPMVQKLKDIPNKKMIIVQKDRVKNVEPVRFAIYDLFIHLVDTALFLLDDEVKSVQSHLVEKEGELKRVWIALETDTTSCFVSMNYEAGANQEVMEIQSPSGIARLSNLTELIIMNDGKKEVLSFGDWENTLLKRGFSPLIHQFVSGLMNKDNPVSHRSTYNSHQLCEQILNNYLF